MEIYYLVKTSRGEEDKDFKVTYTQKKTQTNEKKLKFSQ